MTLWDPLKGAASAVLKEVPVTAVVQEEGAPSSPPKGQGINPVAKVKLFVEERPGLCWQKQRKQHRRWVRGHADGDLDLR